MHEVLEGMAAYCREHDAAFDFYGKGPLLEEFEARIASMLGMEAGLVLPSGTMAQLVALRIYAERAKSQHIGMHPTSHVELHEHRAYSHLHNLRATLVGPVQSPMLAEHVQACPEPLAALLIELPIREAGGQLPTWEELEELKRVTAARGVPLHIDGARLWETRGFYDNRPYHEIVRGASSVYVSLYKGLGGFGGAVLAGSRDFVEQARIWRKRHGGGLVHLAPFVVSTAAMMEQRLEELPLCYQRAVEIAEVVSKLPRISIVPNPPHINMMHIHLTVPWEHVHRIHQQRMESEEELLLLPKFRATPTGCMAELYVGDSALSISLDEVKDAFQELVEL